MIRETIPVGALKCNCSILACEKTRKAVVIDPGGEGEKILERVEELGVDVLLAIHTHAHIDHIGATRLIAEKTGCEILLHRKDLFLYENLEDQIQWLEQSGLPAAMLGLAGRETLGISLSGSRGTHGLARHRGSTARARGGPARFFPAPGTQAGRIRE